MPPDMMPGDVAAAQPFDPNAVGVVPKVPPLTPDFTAFRSLFVMTLQKGVQLQPESFAEVIDTNVVDLIRATPQQVITTRQGSQPLQMGWPCRHRPRLSCDGHAEDRILGRHCQHRQQPDRSVTWCARSVTGTRWDYAATP